MYWFVELIEMHLFHLGSGSRMAWNVDTGSVRTVTPGSLGIFVPAAILGGFDGLHETRIRLCFSAALQLLVVPFLPYTSVKWEY